MGINTILFQLTQFKTDYFNRFFLAGDNHVHIFSNNHGMWIAVLPALVQALIFQSISFIRNNKMMVKKAAIF